MTRFNRQIWRNSGVRKSAMRIVAAVITVALFVSPLPAQKTPSTNTDNRSSKESDRTQKTRSNAAGQPVNDKPRSNKPRSDKSGKARSDKLRGAQKTAMAVAPDREKSALAFAKQHHPELVGLLRQLKDNQKPQYARAIRDLSTARERLHKIQERLPERYERDLKNWKLDSRIRLSLARLQMADPSEVDSLRDELRNLVTKRMDSRLAQWREEKAKLDIRRRKLEDSISQLAGDRDESVDRELKRLERTLTKSRPARKSPRPSIASRKKSKSGSRTSPTSSKIDAKKIDTKKTDAKSTRAKRQPNPKKTQDDQ